MAAFNKLEEIRQLRKSYEGISFVKREPVVVTPELKKYFLDLIPPELNKTTCWPVLYDSGIVVLKPWMISFLQTSYEFSPFLGQNPFLAV